MLCVLFHRFIVLIFTVLYVFVGFSLIQCCIPSRATFCEMGSYTNMIKQMNKVPKSEDALQGQVYSIILEFFEIIVSMIKLIVITEQLYQPLK